MSSIPPEAKKRRLSLSLKGRRTEEATSSSSRFATSTEEDVETAAKGVIPVSTRRVNDWALRTFDEWIRARNTRSHTERVPEDILASNSPEVVCYWLSKFVLEARQESGELYPPKSLYSLLCRLYRIARTKGVRFNFLDKKDHRFINLHNTLDSVFSDLHSKGVGTTPSHAAVISYDDEEKLLGSEVMSMDNPISLLNMFFFYVGLHFCLRVLNSFVDSGQVQNCVFNFYR